jgi:hypothetical protein
MMVQHDITRDELRRRIEAEQPGWHQRASTQTTTLLAGTGHRQFPSLWSEIKRVYMRLQGSKCGFCEKWLEDEPIEHDVEHFRPKGRVDRWLVPAKLWKAGVTVRQPARGPEPGYPRLAYHPLNYVTACKKCNTILKKNWFPISGIRCVDGRDPAKLSKEQALLIYPISDIDDDPEKLISFHGLSPRALITSGFPLHRALVTISVFQLDDWRRRKELNKDRAEFLEKLFWALKQRDNPSSTPHEKQLAASVIGRLTSKKFRHANCLQSFKRLYVADVTEAEAIYLKVHRWLQSVSP